MKRALFSLMLFFAFDASLVGVALACTVPPSEWNELPVEAAYRADSAGIVVFNEALIRGDELVLNGAVEDVFWGDGLELKHLVFPWRKDLEFKENSKTFNHSSPDFWLGKDSNIVYLSDCKLAPQIILGKRYVVLSARPISKYAVEPITSYQDVWLELIRRIGHKKVDREKKRSQTP